MKTLVFLLEGYAERVFLEGFLPRAFPAIADPERFAPPVYITFDGKQDLQQELCRKIRGWNVPNSVFIVLQDQDREKCCVAKERLLLECAKARKKAASVVRIACRELENWYLGDLATVGTVYGVNLENHHKKEPFRVIDKLFGSHELKKITRQQYAKIDGSRRIARHINTDYSQNRSTSFRFFCQAVATLV